MDQDLPKGISEKSNLGRYWTKPVAELAGLPHRTFCSEEAERHRIFSLLTFALIDGYFCGNKNGDQGEYPWRSGQRRPDGVYKGGRYLGHNIACIAVDENGELVDFDFNHNELFNSSAEHAESRLVRRVFSLNQIHDKWQLFGPLPLDRREYGTTFYGLTIYTSLESCAQCSGVMTLANAKSVVYLQSDPGQYRVGNMLYNLTRKMDSGAQLAGAHAVRPKTVSKYGAPEPIDASAFGFGYKEQLEDGYEQFAKQVKADPERFWWRSAPDAAPNTSDSMTTFLCSDLARDVFAAAAGELASMTVAHGDFAPARADGKNDGVKTNAEALEQARAFLRHAVEVARRGTPHR